MKDVKKEKLFEIFLINWKYAVLIRKYTKTQCNIK